MKSLYFKPKSKFLGYEKFTNDFSEKFKLRTLKIKKKNYFLDNDDMLVKLSPDMVEVLVYEESNRNLIMNLKNYFYDKKNPM